eukprot:SAG31_NODE_541_length_14275_cov_6.690886_6_plen_59_part_00
MAEVDLQDTGIVCTDVLNLVTLTNTVLFTTQVAKFRSNSIPGHSRMLLVARKPTSGAK